MSGWYPGRLIDEFFGSSGKYHAQTYSSATDQMAALRQRYVEKWKSMGLNDRQIDLALKLATDWVEGMEDFMRREGVTISPQTRVDFYRVALGVADRWANTMFTERLW